MAVYKITSKQKGPWCSFCDNKTRATLRGYMWGKCACNEHKDQLTEWDRLQMLRAGSNTKLYGGY